MPLYDHFLKIETLDGSARSDDTFDFVPQLTSEPTAAAMGDFNGDVDGRDFLYWQRGSSPAEADDYTFTTGDQSVLGQPTETIVIVYEDIKW